MWGALHRAYCRQFDLWFLWPAFKRQELDLDRRRQAFIIHMSVDPAWKNHFADGAALGDFVRRRLV